MFRGIKGYPSRVVTITIREVEAQFRAIQQDVEVSEEPTTVDESVSPSTETDQETQIAATLFITLPYKGK